MSDIFSKAERVVAWLGEEEKGDRAALKLMEQGSLLPPTPARLSVRSFLSREKDHSSILAETGGINEILKRQWFDRAWIAQELVLSSSVILMCGPQLEIKWDKFFKALVTRAHDHRDQSQRFKEMLRLASSAYALGTTRQSMQQNAKYSLLELLELFSHTKATIEVDKLFALLGLAYDGKDQAFAPDYDSTLEDVVRSYAKGFLDRGHVLDLLYRSGEGKSYSFNSWIPRLTSRNFPRTISQWDSNDGLFAAGRLASPDFATQENGTTFNLKIKGYIVDTIQETDTITVASEAVSQFFQVMTQLRKFLAMVYSESDRRFTENLVQLLIGKSRRPHLDTAVTRVALQGMSSPDTTTTPPQMLWPPSFGELVVRAATQEKTNLDTFSAQLRRAVDVYWQTARVFAAHLGDGQGVVAFCATKRRFVGLVPQGLGKGTRFA